MKNGIALYALGGENWIGGIYYIKNIAFELALNKYITDNFSIYLFTDAKTKSNFTDLPNEINVIEKQLSNPLMYNLVQKQYRIKYSYPAQRLINSIGVRRIIWIPDFQSCRMPDMFSKEECSTRDNVNSRFAKSRNRVILSSADSKKDFMSYYGADPKRIYIVHFVSYIEQIIKNIDVKKEKSILDSFNLEQRKYACIMNQFWQHKNHIVVLEAIKMYFHNNPNSDFKFIFTGKLDDYRAPEYIKKLQLLFQNEEIKKHCLILGFIDRERQIVLMKNAAYVIQPSLFEGWGTVVEDAKVLDKTILLSDIPVHREQMNSNCILFDPHDPITLAKLIEEENKKVHHDDVEAGIADMYKRAKEYSKGFEQLLKDMERK